MQQREAFAKKAASGDLSAVTRYRALLDKLDVTIDERLALLEDFQDRLNVLRPPHYAESLSTSPHSKKKKKKKKKSESEGFIDEELENAREIAYGGCAGLTWEQLKADAGYGDGPASPSRDAVEWAAYLIEKKMGWSTGPLQRAAEQGCVAGFYRK